MDANQQTPSLNLITMDSHQFTNEMIRALRSGIMIEFEERFSTADIMIIKDLQYLAGKDGSQETLLRLSKSLLSRNSLLIFTCDSLPECIDSLTMPMNPWLKRNKVSVTGSNTITMLVNTRLWGGPQN